MISLDLDYSSVLATTAISWIAYQWYLFTVNKAKVRSIPTVGSDTFILSYFSAWRYIFNGHKMIQEGYEKYGGKTFKIPTLATSTGWLIVVSGPKMVEDMRKSNEEHLSFREAAFEMIQADFLFGYQARAEPYHIDVVRGPMTRGFPGRFDDIKDEIFESFSDLLPATDEWKGYQIHKTLIPIVCRTSNRLFVGLPVCRHPEYRKIQEDLTIHVFTAANLLNLLPTFMRGPVGRMITKFPSANKRLQAHLGPIMQERMDMDEKLGKRWEGRPNDLISWLLDLVPDQCRNFYDMTLRITAINFAAIHTTSVTLSNTLFDLAAHREYIEPLRAEVEEVVGQNGWTKESMGKMRKLDSFIKESSRLSGISALSMNRQAVKDFKFSNGDTIPAGFTVAVASASTHNDPSVYDDALTFKGFRFTEMRDNLKGSEAFEHLRHQMVSLDHNYLVFGHGRPACPGRFFAVNEVKAMMAYILMHYDVKLPDDADIPPNGHWFAAQRSPNQFAHILFRKRQRSQTA